MWLWRVSSCSTNAHLHCIFFNHMHIRLKGDHSEQHHGHCITSWISSAQCPSCSIAFSVRCSLIYLPIKRLPVLIHNDVGWLSKGKVLGQEIVFFLAHITTNEQQPSWSACWILHVYGTSVLSVTFKHSESWCAEAEVYSWPSWEALYIQDRVKDFHKWSLSTNAALTTSSYFHESSIWGANYTHDDRFHGEIHWEHSVFSSRYWKKTPFLSNLGQTYIYVKAKEVMLFIDESLPDGAGWGATIVWNDYLWYIKLN